jgi:CBS domain-containing protein
LGLKKEQHMPSVMDIIADKGSDVYTISPLATVLEATHAMNDQKIGALVVKDGGGRVMGIFTERDVLRRVIADEKSPNNVRVGEVMTRDVVCCPPETDIDDASRIMRDRKVRHLPVCDGDGALLGLVSIGDLNAYHASSQEAQIHFLSEYVYGRA